jgi:RHS repeat-associated protein
MVYDPDNRMTSATDFFAQSTTFAYDASGNLTTQTDPNGTVVSSTFDGDANTLNVTATNGATTQGSFTYTYDPADQVLSETDTGTGFPSSTLQAYGYTSTNRVASVNGATTSYTGAGSITGLENGVAQTYNADSQLTSSTPSGGSATTYAYNDLGERTSATEPSTDVTSYTYDQAGRLTSFAPAADLTALSPTSYTYSSGGLLASETTSAGTCQFIWDATGSLPLMLTDGTNAYLYGPSSTPFEQVSLTTDTAASSTFLVSDVQGSVRLQLSDSGALLGTVTYDANGNPSVNTGVMTTPVGYDGQWTDPDTQLVYLRARWLDPATAQFVSVDPMVSSTLQAYGYANENPLNSSDLTGLCNQSSCGNQYQNNSAPPITPIISVNGHRPSKGTSTSHHTSIVYNSDQGYTMTVTTSGSQILVEVEDGGSQTFFYKGGVEPVFVCNVGWSGNKTCESRALVEKGDVATFTIQGTIAYETNAMLPIGQHRPNIFHLTFAFANAQSQYNAVVVYSSRPVKETNDG